MKPEPGQKQYACWFCGTPYVHDKAYIHSILECQKKEREHKPKGE
jgi:hypothetical protein